MKTCTIITTDANELVRPMHDRMPAIVPKDMETLWIDPGTWDREELEAILKHYPADDMKVSEGLIQSP